MAYELYYWPGLQGRGEFVRLALEAAGADYREVAREREGMGAMTAVLGDETLVHPPFAPPFLKHGDIIVAQSANILAYLGPKLGLEPKAERDAVFTRQLALTIADVVAEAHDVHHPVGVGLYYEDQKPEAARRAEEFREQRIEKFLRYFERVLAANAAGPTHLVGHALTYVDLGLFQIVEGLRYAFPNAMKAREAKWPKVIALRGHIATLPKIAAYLASPRRLPFNESGIFRHYPELDEA